MILPFVDNYDYNTGSTFTAGETYIKAFYCPTNDFDSYDEANYDLALRVAYYNFLRPHKHAGFDVLNKVGMLENADTMPGKWQLLIFPGQQTILNLQKQPAA